MRLIDADALDEAMYHEAFETDTDMQKWDGGCWIRYKMFENKIAEAPTVDCLNDVLEKIRFEINGAKMPENQMSFFRDGIDSALRIIDKYIKKVAENEN